MKSTHLTIVTIFLVDVVASQGILETVAAILGLLPTSQILLAGGGLIGLKMAIAARILSLLGLMSENDRKNQFINPHKSIDNMDGTAAMRPKGHPLQGGSVNNETLYFGMPKLDLEGFHKVSHDDVDDVTDASVDGIDNKYGDDNESTVTTTSATANVLENAFFPIPGLQIDCENSTGICGILHMDSLFPSVFLPSEFANKSGLDHKKFENMTNPMFELFKREAHGNQSFLFYPLFPTKVVQNNMHESGLVSATNESQLLLAHSNGTMVSASSVNEFDFHGFHEKKDDRDEQEIVELTRRKRLTEDNIEMYLSLVNKFDDNGCFSRLICEVGAEPERFGRYGNTVDNLFKNLNQTEFDVTTDASHYIGHYIYGLNHGIEMCEKSSICNRNMSELIHPLNEL